MYELMQATIQASPLPVMLSLHLHLCLSLPSFSCRHPLLSLSPPSMLPLLPSLILHPNRIRRLRKLLLRLLIASPRPLTRAPRSLPLGPLLLAIRHSIMLHIRLIRLRRRVPLRLPALPLPVRSRTTQQSRRRRRRVRDLRRDAMEGSSHEADVW